MKRNNTHYYFRYRLGGFTLMELVVTMVIVAILAAVALPSYQKQVQKSRRSSAKSALLDLANREEQYFATNNAYTSDLSQLGYANITNNALQVPSSNEYYYGVAIGNPATTSFQATATPQNSQQSDACGTYKLTDTGAQSNANNTDSNCW